MPEIAVIIVTYNSVPYLTDLLASLKKVRTSVFSQIHWIFVDNHSRDETGSYIQEHFPQGLVIQSKDNVGFAKGNNIGYEKAKQLNCDYVYLLNHDTIVEENFLDEAFLVFSKDNTIAVIQSQLRLYPDKHLLNNKGNMTHYLGYGFCDYYKSPIASLHEDQEITYASGAAMMIKRAVLDKEGLFEDDFFMYAEDQDLCWKLQLLGYKIYLSSQSIVYHKYAFSKSIKQYYWMERNRILVILMNYKLATLLLFSPVFIIFDFIIFIHSIFTGMAKQKIRVYIYFLQIKNWKNVLRKRKVRQKTRTITDKEIMRRFSGTIDVGEMSHPILTYIINPCMNLYFHIIKLFIFW